MRRAARLFLTLTAAASIWAVAAPAHAMTCETNDEVIPSEVGDAACTAFLTVMRPVCSKFACG
jgi:hypothetical protein